MIIKKIFGLVYISFALWYAYIRRDFILGYPAMNFDYISSILIPLGLIALGIFRIRK
ncbi:MAG: hypothetical protein AAGA64_02130 [Bacteroidota bacterium]